MASSSARLSLLGSELRALAAGPLASCFSACGAQVYGSAALLPADAVSLAASPFFCGFATILTASPSARRSLLGSGLRALAVGLLASCAFACGAQVYGSATLLPADAVSLAATPLFCGFATILTASPSARRSLLGSGLRALAVGPLASCVSACGAQIFTAPPRAPG